MSLPRLSVEVTAVRTANTKNGQRKIAQIAYRDETGLKVWEQWFADITKAPVAGLYSAAVQIGTDGKKAYANLTDFQPAKG